MAPSGYGVTVRRDPTRCRHGAAAVGVGGMAVLLVHHPSSRGRARLRLAAARHLSADRARWRRRRPRSSASVPVREAAALAAAVGVRRWRWWCRSPRKAAGVSGRRRARSSHRAGGRDDRHRPRRRASRADRTTTASGPEFPPVLDLVARRRRRRSAWSPPALDAGGNSARVAVAHLRRRGLPRRGHRRDAARPLVPGAAGPAPSTASTIWCGALGWVWPVEVVALLLPTGMFSVLDGSVDDGWNGMLGWFWVACAITTIVLVVRHQGGAQGALRTRP